MCSAMIVFEFYAEGLFLSFLFMKFKNKVVVMKTSY